MHIPPKGDPTATTAEGTSTRIEANAVFLGTFGSRDALIAAYPEYFI